MGQTLTLSLFKLAPVCPKDVLLGRWLLLLGWPQVCGPRCTPKSRCSLGCTWMIEPWFRLIPNLWCQIHRWEAWSASVGLLESTSKTQLTATSQPCRDRLGLVATDPAKVQSSFEILGCCAQVSRRSIKRKSEACSWEPGFAIDWCLSSASCARLSLMRCPKPPLAG